MAKDCKLEAIQAKKSAAKTPGLRKRKQAPQESSPATITARTKEDEADQRVAIR